MVHFLEAFMSARYSSLNRASSVGNDDLFLVTLRIRQFKFLMVLVV